MTTTGRPAPAEPNGSGAGDPLLAAVGVDTETREAGDLAELVGQLVDAHGERLERVLTACSFLVDGTTTRDRALVLAPGAVVDVLPPFAGG